MKRMLLASLLLIGVAISHAYAQSAQFYLYIPDKSIISGVNKANGFTTPQFYDQGINTIIANYQITRWEKATPNSLYDYLQKIYLVECDSAQLAHDLFDYDSTLFPYFEIIPPIDLTGYLPNDWSLHYTEYLNYIQAPDAWAITKGDPNVVIGVNDSYFDMNNPDLQPKIAYLGYNVLPASYQDHGTVVAGLVAGATDNGIGYPAIGFNCRIDAEGLLGVPQLQKLADRGRKILNASWQHVHPTDTLDRKTFFPDQSIFNEMYENGISVCFGAGNGKPNVEKTPRKFMYPASLDHNISVTGVGWENTNPPYNSNIIDVHDIGLGDSVNTHQHNARVDICAPSVRIGGLAFDPNDTSLHFMWDWAWGTSFASPLVAGTLGLMLSVKPSLTPYQREWILKTTSKDIYGISHNAKYYDGVSRHTSRIGSGALNAAAAVAAAADFNDYNGTTKTFKIKGVDVNTRCAPDAFPNVPKPKLKVILENGTPPYTYKWEAVLPDNQVQLSSASPLDSPIVFSCWGNCLLHYRLTVYDASPIQKVASKFIKIQFSTDSTWDLVMRDSYADMFNERNNMDSINAKEWNIWESPDLWNRQTNDKLLVHEDPEYFAAAQNYLYSRIKNIGCAVSPNLPDDIQLNLYWTIASTGETWDMDWMGTAPPINGQPTGEHIGGGGFSIPSIKPGDEYIMETAWNPPHPQSYDTAADIEVCVLGRIVQPGANDGMTIAEDSVTKENVWNNNNIVTRNLVVNNYNTGNKTSTTTLIGVGNSTTTPTTFTLNVLTGKHAEPYLEGNLSKYFTVTLKLGDLYDNWVNGGRLGNPTSYNDGAKTITYDLVEPLRLDNIELASLEKHYIYVTIALKEGVSVPVEIADERIFFRQVIPHEVEIDNGDGTSFFVSRDEVYGSVNFAINVEADESGDAKPSNIVNVERKSEYLIYPNPVKNTLAIMYLGKESKDKADITVVDVAGKTVMTQDGAVFEKGIYRLSTAKLAPGMYFIRISNKADKTYSMKFIKTE